MSLELKFVESRTSAPGAKALGAEAPRSKVPALELKPPGVEAPAPGAKPLELQPSGVKAPRAEALASGAKATAELLTLELKTWS